MQPQVINIRDAPKGWRDDPKYVYIGRYHYSKRYGQITQSKWHNPFKGERKWAVAEFTKHLLRNQELMKALPELEGKTLLCWCKPAECHGDTLVWAYGYWNHLMKGV